MGVALVTLDGGNRVESPWVLDPLHMTIRLVLAVVLGGLIGLEREHFNRPAGFRTHILVCLGSALVMLLSMYGFGQFIQEANVRLDPARLAAQVITGIGFLGAGTIMLNGSSVTGLTTAASLWVVGAIGLAVGAGFYYVACLSTLFVLVALWILNILGRKWLAGKQLRFIRIDMPDQPGSLASLLAAFEEQGAEIRSLAIEKQSQSGQDAAIQYVHIKLSVFFANPGLLMETVEQCRTRYGVKTIRIE